MAGRPAKRPRPAYIQSIPRIPRPTEKVLRNISKSALAAATQVTTTLFTCTYPGTMTGLRWHLSFCDVTASLAIPIQWALVVVKEGNSVTNLSQSDAGTLYNPEGNVLAFGNFLLASGNQSTDFIGNTKAMRKLMGGDTVVMVIRNSDGANQVDEIRGTVQFFLKT